MDAAVQKASWGKVVAACDDVPPAFLPALAIMIVLNNVARRSDGPDSSSPNSKIVTVRSAPPC